MHYDKRNTNRKYSANINNAIFRRETGVSNIKYLKLREVVQQRGYSHLEIMVNANPTQRS